MRRNKKVVMLLIKDFIYPYLDPRVYKEAKSLLECGYNVSVVCWYKLENKVPCWEEYEQIAVHRIFLKVPYYTTSVQS